jgi:TPR repeat protein
MIEFPTLPFLEAVAARIKKSVAGGAVRLETEGVAVLYKMYGDSYDKVGICIREQLGGFYSSRSVKEPIVVFPKPEDRAEVYGAIDTKYDRIRYRRAPRAETVATESGGVDAEAENDSGLRHVQARNYEKARDCFQKAAAAGHVKAMGNLGFLYCKYPGSGFYDPHEAVLWLRKAVAAGNLESHHVLAGVLADGLAGERDLVEAARLYQEAAIKGHAPSQFTIATMHVEGVGGMEKSLRRARLWAERALGNERTRRDAQALLKHIDTLEAAQQKPSARSERPPPPRPDAPAATPPVQSPPAEASAAPQAKPSTKKWWEIWK